MHFTYRTKGTCSQEILFDVDGKTVKNIEFIGGCNGNLQGISKLVEGMDIDTVIERLDGIHRPACERAEKGQGKAGRGSLKNTDTLPPSPDLKIPDAGVSSVRYFCDAKA